MGIAHAADFVNGPMRDMGRPATCFRVVKVVSNIEGDENIEPGLARSLTIILYPTTTADFVQKKEGLVEDHDARCFTLPADVVQKNDILSYEGKFYRVDKSVRRFADEANSTPIYDYHLCYLWESLPRGPVPGSGRFIGPIRGIPESASLGDWWYDTLDKQFKGYDGTQVVILG